MSVQGNQFGFDCPVPASTIGTGQTSTDPLPLESRRKAFLLAMSPIVVDLETLQPFLREMVEAGLFEVKAHGRDTHLVRTVTGDFYMNQYSASNEPDDITLRVMSEPQTETFINAETVERFVRAAEQSADMLTEIASHLGALARAHGEYDD